MDFSQRVRMLRDRAGLTQEAMAEKLGITNRAVGAWESGRARPRLAKMQELADLFGVTVSELMGEAEQLQLKGAPVKNPESERPVVLPEPWSLRLLEIADDGRRREHDYLNDDGCGRPCSRAMISDAWRSAFRAGGPLHGVPYLRMQKLRNSWETFMRWELGVDKDKIDKMMGHTSPDVRSIYYDRPDEIMFAETVAEAYERRVRRAVGTI